jgi:hypothetical protein
MIIVQDQHNIAWHHRNVVEQRRQQRVKWWWVRRFQQIDNACAGLRGN